MVLISQIIFSVLLLSAILGSVYGLIYVWTHPVSIFAKWEEEAKNNFPSERKFVIPMLDYKFTFLSTKYERGLNVDGIFWNDDFEEYRLFVRNLSNTTDVSDLRINMDLPGGVIQSKIISEAGCDGIKIREADMVGGGLAKTDGVVVKTVKQYSNNFYITANKLFPDAYFEIRLILKIFKPVEGAPLDDNEGIFDAKYRYINSEQEMQNRSEVFKIFLEKDKKISIDTQNPLVGNITRSTAIVFDTPLTLGASKVAEEKQSDKPEPNNK